MEKGLFSIPDKKFWPQNTERETRRRISFDKKMIKIRRTTEKAGTHQTYASPPPFCISAVSTHFLSAKKMS